MPVFTVVANGKRMTVSNKKGIVSFKISFKESQCAFYIRGVILFLFLSLSDTDPLGTVATDGPILPTLDDR
jgi:hypothetical protein